MLSTCHAECVRVAVISRYACLLPVKDSFWRHWAFILGTYLPQVDWIVEVS